MTPPKIDLGKICPELAKAMELIKHREQLTAWRSEPIKLKSQDVVAIAATMLAQQAKIDKLAEEKEKEYHKGYDDGVTGQKRRGRPVPSMTAQKGDEHDEKG